MPLADQQQRVDVVCLDDGESIFPLDGGMIEHRRGAEERAGAVLFPG